MDWMTIAEQVINVCIIPLLGMLTKFLIDFLVAKKEEAKTKVKNETLQKYIELLNETVVDCVNATHQTYVEALKKQNAFTAEAQKEAFQLTYNAVMAILTDDAKNYLAEIYGDVSAYITNKIEAEVNISKIVPVE
jgi:wyosine [tRNA(Phe)-imidazoG37] synthetase (radical SAM superfamily)